MIHFELKMSSQFDKGAEKWRILRFNAFSLNFFSMKSWTILTICSKQYVFPQIRDILQLAKYKDSLKWKQNSNRYCDCWSVKQTDSLNQLIWQFLCVASPLTCSILSSIFNRRHARIPNKTLLAFLFMSLNTTKWMTFQDFELIRRKNQHNKVFSANWTLWRMAICSGYTWKIVVPTHVTSCCSIDKDSLNICWDFSNKFVKFKIICVLKCIKYYFEIQTICSII